MSAASLSWEISRERFRNKVSMNEKIRAGEGSAGWAFNGRLVLLFSFFLFLLISRIYLGELTFGAGRSVCFVFVTRLSTSEIDHLCAVSM